jgi:RimJ/RimL family protein N-acetyltransferase
VDDRRGAVKPAVAAHRRADAILRRHAASRHNDRTGAVTLAPGMRELTLRLSLPDGGISDGEVLLRLPTMADIDALMPALSDPELREAANLPDLSRAEMEATIAHLPGLMASGRLMPMTATDATTREAVGGGILHHLDAEREIVEIGYWVLPHARRRGMATRIARLLAGHAFGLGVKRVAAYVNVGNVASERVLERAGYTREGIIRSMPKPGGVRRVDKTLFSLLPGE